MIAIAIAVLLSPLFIAKTATTLAPEKVKPAEVSVRKYDVHTQRPDLGTRPVWPFSGCVPALDLDGFCPVTKQ